MAKPRDSQRQRVYDSEDVLPQVSIYGGSFSRHNPPTIPECQRYVDKLLADAWVQRTFGYHRITVEHNGGAGGARAFPGSNTIRVSGYFRHQRIILHELAHILRPLEGWAAGTNISMTSPGYGPLRYTGKPGPTHAGHGREFAHTFLLLVQHFMGKRHADALRASFRKHRVKFTAPRQMSPETLERLREQGRRLAAAKQRPGAAQAQPAPLAPDWRVATLTKFMERV